MFLEDIVNHKKGELLQYKHAMPLSFLENAIKDLPPARDFASALSGQGTRQVETSVRIIAEIKKASPSRGTIREDFKPLEIARLYEENGAVALSVLTDRKFFQGSFDYLQQISKNISLPILDKDFVVDPYQIYQARYYGADAVLLIAAILTDDQLSRFLDISTAVGIDALVEVHTLAELERVLKSKVKIIGINNRDLKTFKVNTGTSVRLKPYIPDDIVVVSESGINTRKKIQQLLDLGIDAFLIGESLMKAADIGEKLRTLINGKE